ncbi:hypothetical protein J5226_19540 [Lysobacter sp. K5869]|uniref:hypothetical protein n=1 Tax=Lysobacter sp. K5869 TaxID=2820808 RepID=UPI001C061A74|nr:hypothetical protein [Lysobacter sp. K5869]QWP75781.1 hypothetical protein J5226_19540 [Lysobacter sp. K5869]
MDKLIELWPKYVGSPWLMPLSAFVLLPWIIKGLFSLQRSRSQDRKDFLDLWAKRDQSDNLWLQVAVKHLFREYLPVSILRYLIERPQAGRALIEVSEVWPLIDWDDTSGCLFWRDASHFLKVKRVRDYRWSLAGYFFSAAVTLTGLWLVLAGHVESGWVEWTYLFAGMVVTGHLLVRQERLKTAEEVIPRWLGEMPWRGGGCSHDETNGASSKRRRAKQFKR